MDWDIAEKGKEDRLEVPKSWLYLHYYEALSTLFRSGYFVSTVGLSEQSIIKYVRWQEAQDSGQAKLDL